MSNGDATPVRIGPAGWSYEDWKGIVYPRTMPRGAHPLDYIARWFDTVEINVSFYRVLDPKFGTSWVEKVQDHPEFRFTAKLWERFTHKRGAFPSDDDLAAYRRGIDPLMEAGRLGALLAQFPWSFKRTTANRCWLGRLLDALQDYPLAVEVRHASWNADAFYDGLRERKVAFCNIDQPVFRDSIGPSGRVTADLGYVRLHGRNYDAWFDDDAPSHERYNYLYTAEELNPWLAHVRAIRARTDAVYVVTNNHFRGKAIVNAFEMSHALGRGPRDIPESLLNEYPRLRALTEAAHSA